MNSESWLARAGSCYGSVTVVWLIAALLAVGGLVDVRDYWEAVVAATIALIIHATYVVLVRNHLTVPWRTVEQNALDMGVVLGLVALSVAVLGLDNQYYSYQVPPNGLGVALSSTVAGIVSRFALRQLRNPNAERPSTSQAKD